MDKKKLVWIAIVIIIFVAGFFLITSQHDSHKNLNNETKCVPASCCHSTSCVPENEAPDCRRLSCTMDCVPHTLDCGQGSCKYIKGKCEAVLNE